MYARPTVRANTITGGNARRRDFSLPGRNNLWYMSLAPGARQFKIIRRIIFIFLLLFFSIHYRGKGVTMVAAEEPPAEASRRTPTNGMGSRQSRTDGSDEDSRTTDRTTIFAPKNLFANSSCDQKKFDRRFPSVFFYRFSRI